MKRFLLSALSLVIAVSCDNGYLESESKEELVVEGWIEAGHAPVVLVSSSLPVSSDPQPIENVKDHILRYAKVYIDCDSVRYYLTARLSDNHVIQNYFTSVSLRGESGKTYRLGVEWSDYEATAVCTIPQPTPIDSAWFEKQYNDTSYVAKILFRNNPVQQKYYKSFLRCGHSLGNTFSGISFTALDGSLIGETVTETFMKPYTSEDLSQDLYFHPGDSLAVKLATMEKQMYDFWASYDNAYNGSSVLTAPANLKGNVDGAIGYWAGYAISIVTLAVPQ